MKPKLLSILLLIISANYCSAQSIKTLAEINTSLRGLSVVDDKTIWASGSNGMVGRSLDSGNSWRWLTVDGFEKIDFRDIEAFDETSAVIMGTSVPAYILRTSDGGESWKVVFEDTTKGMFLDAMEFWNDNSGIVIGDPIDSKFFVARSFDGGFTWRKIPPEYFPQADTGEACFAASGTNVCKINNKEAVFVSGGKKSRIFIRDKKIDLPFTTGTETAGGNSIATKNNKIFIVAGGDYLSPDSTSKNCFISKDGGNRWIKPVTPPSGYRSCVEYIVKKNWITCGLNGVDYTSDDGINWKLISNNGYNVCKKAKNGKAVFLAGDGKVGKLIF
ncbi:MAG: oxidoreductase [Bacteroidota bacterium]